MIQYDIAKTIFTDDIYCNPSGSYTPKHWLGGGMTSGVKFGLAHSSDGL